MFFIGLGLGNFIAFIMGRLKNLKSIKKLKVSKKCNTSRILSALQIDQIIQHYKDNCSIHKIAKAVEFSWKAINKVIKKEITSGIINENLVTLAYKDRQTNRYDNILHNIYI